MLQPITTTTVEVEGVHYRVQYVYHTSFAGDFIEEPQEESVELIMVTVVNSSPVRKNTNQSLELLEYTLNKITDEILKQHSA